MKPGDKAILIIPYSSNVNGRPIAVPQKVIYLGNHPHFTVRRNLVAILNPEHVYGWKPLQSIINDHNYPTHKAGRYTYPLTFFEKIEREYKDYQFQFVNDEWLTDAEPFTLDQLLNKLNYTE